MQGIITLDWETAYSTEYSLTRLTTEEYIRDPRFEGIGVGLQHNDGKTHWITGTHEQIGNKLHELPWHNLGLLAHNCMFDAAIMNWHFDIRPKALFDTLSMARPIVGPGGSVGLANLAKRFNIGEKGDEVINARGKWRKDFTPAELARYADYGKLDVHLTWKLFQRFMSVGYPLDELKLIDLTLRMFTEPVLRIDGPRVDEHLRELVVAKKELLIEVMVQLERSDIAARIAVGDDEALAEVQKFLRSDAMFADALTKLGVTPPMKISKRTGKEAFAFAKPDKEFKALADHPDVRVQTLHAARVGVKTTQEESRAERFAGIASRGTLPVPLRYCGALTFRWSGQDKVNFQNLSSRGEHGGKLKSAILPPEGYMYIAGDSSQIEARVLAWLAGQDDLVQAFAEKRDVYSETASTIYRREIDRKRVVIDEDGKETYPDFVEGFVGKTTILSAGYGAGGGSFKEMLRVLGGVDVTLEEAKRIIDTYRARYPMIPQFWRTAGKAIEAIAAGQEFAFGRNGLIVTTPEGLAMPNGMVIKYPELHRRKNEETGYNEWIYMAGKMPVYTYGGKLCENICQSLSRIVIGEQMLRVAKRYKVVNTVHDEISIVAPIEHARAAKAYLEECMTWAPDWAEGLPLACEIGAGLSYGAA